MAVQMWALFTQFTATRRCRFKGIAHRDGLESVQQAFQLPAAGALVVHSRVVAAVFYRKAWHRGTIMLRQCAAV
jgi:hypothetical protein